MREGRGGEEKENKRRERNRDTLTHVNTRVTSPVGGGFRGGGKTLP
jgi:hypothetical protein